MKKFFLLIPALVLSIVLNANVISITPTSPHSSNNLRQAIAAASSGDIVEMAAGTYVETGNWIAFDDKEVIVRAAEGAEVIIKPQFSVRVKAGDVNQIGKAEFIGVKFDCSALESDQLFVPSDDKANQSIVLKNCELYDWSKNDALIKTNSDRRIDAINIDNCYFHGFAKSIIFLQNTNPVNLSVTNSTFANVTGVTDSYDAAPIDVRAGSGSVLVDHCTFYNVNSKSLSYGTVTVKTIADPVVSNCIFMLTASVDRCATYLKAGGNVKNCLTWNYDNWQPYGHYNTATVTDCVKANPLFKDAANNDFTLHNASPARRENGTVYGDPRWAKAIEPITIPATLQPIDAMLSDSAGVVLGTPDFINFKALGSHQFNDTEYAKWIITVDKKRIFSFTINANNPTEGTSHKYTIQVFAQNDEVNPILDQTTTSSSAAGDFLFKTNTISLNEGIYIVKVWNPTSWSVGNLVNVTASYEGGDIVAIPATLMPIDALRSEYAQLIHGDVDTLTFARLDHEWEAVDADYTVDGSQYVKWNINIQKAGKYKFTANTYCTQGHNYRIILLSENEASTIGTWLEKDDISEYDFHTNVDYPVSTPVLDLTSGNYVFKMQAREKGRVMSVVATYEGGAVVNAPGEIQAVEAVIYDNGYKKMFHNADGDLEYGNSGTPSGEYAYWNINATEAGEMAVSFNSPSGGHNFLFELYEGTTLLESVSEEGTDAIWEHNVTLANHLTIPAAGTYTLRVHNRTQWSTAILHSVTIEPYVAPAGVTMNDTDLNNLAWVANVGGNAVNVQMNRTILGGMYNTICLPFKVSSTQCKAIFGNDVELYTLGSASLSGDILNLQFNTASDIWNGTPILIKTSSDITNPVFENVTIESETADHTNGGFVTFQGTFVQKDFHNGDQVLLLLANNQLAYPQQDRTLKGFRAYFQINGGANSAPIRRANIITPNKVPTEINLVELENNGIIKTIENGQLIIIRDGVRYNAMGVMIE